MLVGIVFGFWKNIHQLKVHPKCILTLSPAGSTWYTLNWDEWEMHVCASCCPEMLPSSGATYTLRMHHFLCEKVVPCPVHWLPLEASLFWVQCAMQMIWLFFSFSSCSQFDAISLSTVCWGLRFHLFYLKLNLFFCRWQLSVDCFIRFSFLTFFPELHSPSGSCISYDMIWMIVMTFFGLLGILCAGLTVYCKHLLE